nr:hypothetical protein Iba_chr01aCG17220 [Ipomoea batatas]
MSGVPFLQKPLLLQMKFVLETLHRLLVYNFSEMLGAAAGSCEVAKDEEGAGGHIGGSRYLVASFLAALASSLFLGVWPRFMVDKSSSDRGFMTASDTIFSVYFALAFHPLQTIPMFTGVTVSMLQSAKKPPETGKRSAADAPLNRGVRHHQPPPITAATSPRTRVVAVDREEEDRREASLLELKTVAAALLCRCC